MKYFGIYNNSGDVQTALAEFALAKPYVAIVSGALDYNTLEPQSANYIGVWSDDGQGTYTFQVLDGESFELGDVEIATSELYFNGDLTNMVFLLNRYFDDGFGGDCWKMTIYPVEGDYSDGVEYTFYGADTWEVQELLTEQDGSDYVYVDFDGSDTFTFRSNAHTPLSLNTINPEAPVGE